MKEKAGKRIDSAVERAEWDLNNYGPAVALTITPFGEIWVLILIGYSIAQERIPKRTIHPLSARPPQETASGPP